MLAVACALGLPASALAEDHAVEIRDAAAEIPDVAASQPQPATSGPVHGLATAASAAPALWATVNICDTEGAPNSMGVRASMSGSARAQRMFMRFSAEYWSRSAQAWTPVPGSGRSPWVNAGSASAGRRQAGWTFAFAAPPAGVAYTMRAHVEFEWRTRPRTEQGRGFEHRDIGRGTGSMRRFDLLRSRASRPRVVRSTIETTVTGVPGVDGGDPAGTSKAMCLIY